MSAGVINGGRGRKPCDCTVIFSFPLPDDPAAVAADSRVGDRSRLERAEDPDLARDGAADAAAGARSGRAIDGSRATSGSPFATPAAISVSPTSPAKSQKQCLPDQNT